MSNQDAGAADERRTDDVAYADRLVTLTGGWKQKLDVQRPYRWNLTRQHLGRTLDVGCGIGRNLRALSADSVGIDHNPHSVRVAADAGLTAMTTAEFLAGDLARPAAFDAVLLAHVAEHMTPGQARDLLGEYVPYVRPGGRVMIICPQEKGYTTDATHVTFLDLADLESLARDSGLTVDRTWSFPLPRRAGTAFAYNESCLLARVPA